MAETRNRIQECNYDIIYFMVLPLVTKKMLLRTQDPFPTFSMWGLGTRLVCDLLRLAQSMWQNYKDCWLSWYSNSLSTLQTQSEHRRSGSDVWLLEVHSVLLVGWHLSAPSCWQLIACRCWSSLQLHHVRQPLLCPLFGHSSLVPLLSDLRLAAGVWLQLW